MNKKSKLSRSIAIAIVGCGEMAFAGTALAAGTIGLPGLFSIDHNLQVIGGSVTADCPAGSTCQELPGTGDGLLVRTVSTSGGNTYIQSIVAENLAGGGLFANEQDVLQGVTGVQNSSNITQKMVINDVANGFTANHTIVDSLFSGNLNGIPYYTLNQAIDMGNGAIAKVRLRGSINAAGGDLANTNHSPAQTLVRGKSLYVDQLGGPNEREMGDFVFRSERTPLIAQNQTLNNTLGTVSTGITGARVGALFINQSVTGMDNDFGLLKYGENLGVTGGAASGTWTPTLISMDILSGNPSSNMTSLDPTDAYGTWGTNSTAERIFGVLGSTTDFSIQGLMP